MDALGDRMKKYEELSPISGRFIPLLPIVIRVDGSNFHSFCKKQNVKKPFDDLLHQQMIDVTKFLVCETGAVVAYTQSDEISLVLYSSSSESQVFHDGRIFKIVSRLSSLATKLFMNVRAPDLEGFVGFDCRAWQVPSKEEAVNYLVWRELDATKNAISMAARSMFSHAKLQGLTGNQMQELMFQEKQINFNDYPIWAKRGTYIRKKKIVRVFTTEELAKLPPKHAARINPDIQIIRTVVEVLNPTPLRQINNKVQFIFDGVEAISIT